VNIKDLKDYFKDEGIDDETSDLIINQLDDYIDNGSFDYKKFGSTIY
jgi:hypothetical protein